MTDQAAGLRAWADPDALQLGVIGEPGDDALMQALTVLPTSRGGCWQALRVDQLRGPALAWMLWVDTAQIDVADLYRRVKRALAPPAASSPPTTGTPVTLLLWLHDGGTSTQPSLDSATTRLLANLSMTLKRFLNVELTPDLARWQRCVPMPG
ncbi:hypothetical protein [Salinicola sp. CPA57]|uniref:hypothetical protein n=1 Tax=Salinicola sp. CPA57 TaxID=1949080 RepID=UPI000DA1C4D4|nr:hypothetical protein [Salinicola sp. CPA57]